MNQPSIQILPDPVLAPIKAPKFIKTADSNIYTMVSTGGKYVRASICGRQFSKTLKTKSQEVARRKALVIIDQERRRRSKCSDENVTFKQLADEFRAAIEADTKLKPRSKAYRIETLEQLERTWPELYEKKPSEVTAKDCDKWAREARSVYSPTRFNGTVETLRRIVGLALEKGILDTDPTTNIDRASVPLTTEELPDLKQVRALIEELDKPPEIDSKRSPRGRSKILLARKKRAADVIKFMLFTGCRIGATKDVTPANIDLARNEIILPKIKYDDKPVRVPIFREARPFFTRLLADARASAIGTSAEPCMKEGGNASNGPVFTVLNPSKVLASACKAVGIKRLTCHNMRDLFATVALQNTKDVALVASWLGHKDKGITLLKRYAHILNDHAQREAMKVKFF